MIKRLDSFITVVIIILTMSSIFISLKILSPAGSVVCLYLMCIFSVFILATTLLCGSILTPNKFNIEIYAYVYTIIFFISSCFTVSFMLHRNTFYIKLFDLVCFEDFIISFDVYATNQSVLMSYVVLSVSYFVSMFSVWYLHKDPNSLRFLVLITYFTFFMLILVNSNNLVILFVGWEGIGLFSYLLINFWSTRNSANRSALKAILFNKIGDCALYFFMFLYWFSFKTFNVNESFNISFLSKYDSSFFGLTLDSFILTLIVIASMAKSAQIILHVWLPDAMEGPTPVSALLHAATMVTAGIFLLIKFGQMFECNTSLYKVVLWVGLVTNLMASIIAFFQNDIKKIVAYSTASQIGIIYTAFGTGKSNLSLFHIINHAYFKSFLFILSGIIIHNYISKQDVREYKRLTENRYFIYTCFLVCAFSLLSLPFFSGYYSKELIINAAYLNSDFSGKAANYLLNLSTITTSLYTMKILYYLFFCANVQIIYKDNNKQKHEIDYFMLLLIIVIVVLMLYTVFVGFTISGINRYWYLIMPNEYADNLLPSEKAFDSEYAEVSIVMILLFTFSSIIASAVLIKFNFLFNKDSSNWKDSAFKKFYFNEINFYIISLLLPIINFFSYFLDKLYIENFVKILFSPFNRIRLRYKHNSFDFKIKVIVSFSIICQAIFFSYVISYTLKDFLLMLFCYFIVDRILTFFFWEEDPKRKAQIEKEIKEMERKILHRKKMEENQKILQKLEKERRERRERDAKRKEKLLEDHRKKSEEKKDEEK